MSVYSGRMLGLVYSPWERVTTSHYYYYYCYYDYDYDYDYDYNHNYNKIVKSDWLLTALISALIGHFDRTVRVMPK